MRPARLRIVGFVLACFAGGAAAAQTMPSSATSSAKNGAQSGSVTALLLQQARYWQRQGQLDQARASVKRALQVTPNDPDALLVEGELQAQQGDLDEARHTAAILSATAPASSQLEQLRSSIDSNSVNPDALRDARALAASGNISAAIAGYRALFGGRPPPAFAREYYETLAGIPSGQNEALAGLSRIVSADPDDLEAQLAYARVLTYQESSRSIGIDRLEQLATSSKASVSVADAAGRDWREALGWLPVDKASVPSWQSWLQHHPGDKTISDRIAAAEAQGAPSPQAAARTAGFSALSAGRLTDAASQFQASLATAPDDANALGGLGLVRQRQGRDDEARNLLSRAIAADPNHADHWQAALHGLSVRQDYLVAQRSIDEGHFGLAERQLDLILQAGGNTTGARLMLAEVAERRGDDRSAETTFREVLRSSPDETDALLGLARLFARDGRAADAQQMLDRLGGRRSRAAAEVEADLAESRVSSSGNLTERTEQLRAASLANPSNPWLKLRLAQALLQAGKDQEARTVIAPLLTGADESSATLRAGALFSAQIHDYATAGRLYSLLPLRDRRSADMQSVERQVELEQEIVAGQSDDLDGNARLFALARVSDPDGTRGVQIAQALLARGDRRGAARSLRIALDSTPVPTPTQHLAYAGSFLGMGDAADAHKQLRAIEVMQDQSGGNALTAEQARARRQLEIGVAVVESDRLNAEGKQADAFDRLAPAIAAAPKATATQLALARLYKSDNRPKQALTLDLAVLERDPADADARLAAVEDAISADDIAQAISLAHEGTESLPEDPRSWLALAAVDRARGAGPAALADLRRARDLRRQQIGVDDVDAAADDPPSPESGNPFRRDDGAGDPGSVNGDETDNDPTDPSATPDRGSPGNRSDPTLASINQQIANLSNDLAPKLEIGVGLRDRSGTGGLDSLVEATTPLVATLPVGAGAARWILAVTPTVLSSGNLDGTQATLAQFGTLALSPALSTVSGDTSAAGVALDAKYAYEWFDADLGSSPLGFRLTNPVGGIELAPKISPNLTFRVTGEHRAVTDSVLSYAGIRNPGTGEVWGGVTRTRGHAQLELANADTVVYAGAGFDSLGGTHVANNTEAEAGFGGSATVWRRETDQVRVGVDFTYFGYDRNLRYFTLGQGGYFSPQSYYAVVIPVTYKGSAGRWSWSIAGGLGYQNYTEDTSPYYPDDTFLQARLQQSDPRESVFPGDTVSGLVGNASGTLDYKVSDALHLGATASYQRAGDYDEGRALLSAQYAFIGQP